LVVVDNGTSVQAGDQSNIVLDFDALFFTGVYNLSPANFVLCVNDNYSVNCYTAFVVTRKNPAGPYDFVIEYGNMKYDTVSWLPSQTSGDLNLNLS